jgi:hypothetical protein
MADRKKQPACGARRRKPPKKKQEIFTIEPLEVHIQLIGIQRNSKGEVVGKAPMLEGTLLPPDFSSIPKRIKDSVKEHQEAAKQGEAG